MSEPPDTAASAPPRTFEGGGVSVTVHPWGLLVRRRWHRPRRVWWEEVRRVGWLDRGRARLWLTAGPLEFDASLSGLQELVTLVDERASEVRAAWRERFDPVRCARLLAVRPGQTLTLPDGSRGAERLDRAVGVLLDYIFVAGLYRVMYWWRGRGGWGLALGAAAFVVAVVSLDDSRRSRGLLGRALWQAFCAGLAGPRAELGATRPARVQVSTEALWCDRERHAWEDVRGCRVVDLPGRAAAEVEVQLADRRLVFTLSTLRSPRVVWAFRVLADLSSHEFVHAGDEPPPATALSLARLSGDHEAERGLSVTREERP